MSDSSCTWIQQVSRSYANSFSIMLTWLRHQHTFFKFRYLRRTATRLLLMFLKILLVKNFFEYTTLMVYLFYKLLLILFLDLQLSLDLLLEKLFYLYFILAILAYYGSILMLFCHLLDLFWTILHFLPLVKKLGFL